MFKIGDIVRYAAGSTAYCKLVSEHCGGFHAEHYLGGVFFVVPNKLQHVTAEEKLLYLQGELV